MITHDFDHFPSFQMVSFDHFAQFQHCSLWGGLSELLSLSGSPTHMINPYKGILRRHENERSKSKSSNKAESHKHNVNERSQAQKNTFYVAQIDGNGSKCWGSEGGSP